mgnify:CR=1 FL=1
MKPAHIAIIGILVVILIVVVMARNKVNNRVADRRAALANLRGTLMSDYDRMRAGQVPSQPSMPADDGSATEHFNWSAAYNYLEEQAQQKRELRDASFPTNTVFARLGSMLESCRSNNTPQCQAFKKFAYAMTHPNQ